MQTTLQLGFRQSQLILFNVLYTFLFLLHTHYMFRPLQAIFKWIIYSSYFTRSYFTTMDLLLVLLIIESIYFLPYIFGNFLPLAACMWWICLLIILIHTLFEYLSLYIKTDKNPLNNGDVSCSYFSLKHCLLKMSCTFKMLKY
jgi:hypothetical protein